MVRCRIAAREQCAAKMSHSLKTFTDASDEKFAAPDRAVIAVARAVETDAHDSLLPFAALGEHGGEMRAMMLDASRVRR